MLTDELASRPCESAESAARGYSARADCTLTGSLRKLQDGKGITVRAARDHVWFQRRIPKVPR